MGNATSGPIRLSFNPQLRVEFQGATVTSDAGLLLPRELDERLGLSARIERHLSDPRTRYNRQDLLTRPRGRPSHAPLVRYRRFSYQAASWDRPRRVIAITSESCFLGWASSSPS